MSEKSTGTNMKKMISYVFPIYNESGNIDLLYKTIASVIKPIEKKYDIELIFVNDGSKDDSIDLLYRLLKDPRVVIIDLARNFGHQLAVTAGVDEAKGDAVIIMDSDLQDPPKVSLELIKRWEEGYEVVYAQRRSRKDSLFKRFTADMFYRTLQRLAEIDIPRNTGDFRLVDRKVVDVLKQYKEHNRFLRGMAAHVGFKQIAVQFDRDERHAGTSNYPLRKMVRLAADGILSFSSAPLKLISRLGYFISLFSVLGILYALGVKIFSPSTTIDGWTFTVISIFFIGGVQLVMLGVIGSYIGRIYTEVQNRPLYSISSVNRSRK